MNGGQQRRLGLRLWNSVEGDEEKDYKRGSGYQRPMADAPGSQIPYQHMAERDDSEKEHPAAHLRDSINNEEAAEAPRLGGV